LRNRGEVKRNEISEDSLDSNKVSKNAQLYVMVPLNDPTINFWKPFLDSVKPDDVVLRATETTLLAGLSVASCELLDHQFARIKVNVRAGTKTVELSFLVPRQNILSITEGREVMNKADFRGFLGGTA
jgi:hypothetical protein